MKIASAALAAFAAVLLSSAVYLSPKCQPGQGGAVFAGTLMNGCK